MEGMKVCCKCNIEKDLIKFRERLNKAKTAKYRTGQCKDCDKEYRDNNKEMLKISAKRWVELNPDKVLAKAKRYRDSEYGKKKRKAYKRSEHGKNQEKKSRIKCKDKINKRRRDIYIHNGDYLRKYKREYHVNNNIRVNELKKAHRLRLPDGYVIEKIAVATKLDKSIIKNYPILIELKRKQIKLKRKSHEQTKCLPA